MIPNINRVYGKSPSLVAYALRITIPIGVAILLTTWYIENNLLQSTIEENLRKHIVNIEARERKQIQNNLNGLPVSVPSAA